FLPLVEYTDRDRLEFVTLPPETEQARGAIGRSHCKEAAVIVECAIANCIGCAFQHGCWRSVRSVPEPDDVIFMRGTHNFPVGAEPDHNTLARNHRPALHRSLENSQHLAAPSIP